jgi:hypothetical protein
MRAIKLQSHVDETRTLHLKLPEDVQEGPAEVIVLVPDAGTESPVPTLRAFLAGLGRPPRQTRSKEEIDRALEEERASWDS